MHSYLAGLRWAIREARATIQDAAKVGDWPGHLGALWGVLRGGVTEATRAGWPREGAAGE